MSYRRSANPVVRYLQAHDLLPRLQSAYRRHHLTDTALLRVLSDINAAFDRQEVTLQGLLDLSAALDCVDHDATPPGAVIRHQRHSADMDQVVPARRT